MASRKKTTDRKISSTIEAYHFTAEYSSGVNKFHLKIHGYNGNNVNNRLAEAYEYREQKKL